MTLVCDDTAGDYFSDVTLVCDDNYEGDFFWSPWSVMILLEVTLLM